MSRLIVSICVVLLLVGCGGSKSTRDTAQGGDTAALDDSNSGMDALADDGSASDDVLAQKDTAYAPDVAVLPLACSESCGGVTCGAATCYTCDPENQCVDISSSLWDQGLFDKAIWAP